jgi:hypothetical protein
VFALSLRVDFGFELLKNLGSVETLGPLEMDQVHHTSWDDMRTWRHGQNIVVWIWSSPKGALVKTHCRNARSRSWVVPAGSRLPNKFSFHQCIARLLKEDNSFHKGETEAGRSARRLRLTCGAHSEEYLRNASEKDLVSHVSKLLLNKTKFWWWGRCLYRVYSFLREHWIHHPT